MLLSKLKVIIQSTNFIFHVPWKMVRTHTAFLITDYFDSSNSVILWICALYKHSFIFLMVFVSRWLSYWFLLYSQKCRILKNIRTIYPPTVFVKTVVLLCFPPETLGEIFTSINILLIRLSQRLRASLMLTFREESWLHSLMN